MSERKKNIGTVLLSIGSFIILLEIVGIFTGTLGGPPFLYFLGGALDGVGMVFFIGGFVIREEYGKNLE
ncbi:MAG: hypothetical protein ACXABN_17330 [Candidatus Thorarchaeota archaeon]